MSSITVFYCYTEFHNDICRNVKFRYAECQYYQSSNTECCYAEGNFAECHYAYCRYAERLGVIFNDKSHS
jgi:hypothetical protein